MNRRLFASTVLTVLGIAMLTSAPAEARRLFWWQHDRNYDAPQYDSFEADVYDDAQDLDVEEEFNQAQYDLYMREMRHARRQQVLESYYDPQYDVPVYEKPVPKKIKKKPVAKVVAAKPIVVSKPVAKISPPSDKTIQTASLSSRFDDKVAPTKIDCKKGASIVSGYGFSTVTTKSCTGDTLVYGATRSGKNFEIQVSSASGELTTVKKL